MKTRVKIAVVVLALAFVCHGCGIYSFSGASIPAEAKTVSVDYFPNHAQLVNPLLSDNLTNALRDAMNNQTTLYLIESGGDLAFEGEITDYRTSPAAISGQTAAMNREKAPLLFSCRLSFPWQGRETAFESLPDWCPFPAEPQE